MGVLDVYVARLLQGEPGERVMADLRQRYANRCTLIKTVSRIRRMFVDAVPRDDETNRVAGLDNMLRDLERRAERSGAAQCVARAREFVGASTMTQLKLQRRHRSRKFCFDEPEVDAFFRTIRILPENMDSFHVNSDEYFDCKQIRQGAFEAKTGLSIVVEESTDVLSAVRDIVHRPETAQNMPELICALLLVCGRRTYELMNAKSTFARHPKNKHCCTFHGQAKKGDGPTSAFTIPLLVEFSTFKKAYAHLQRMQGDLDAIRAMTPEKVSQRYQGNLSRYLSDDRPFGVETEDSDRWTAHSLRAMYARFVYELFDWKSIQFPLMAKRILGHTSVTTSLSYSGVILENVGRRNSLGVFPEADAIIAESRRALKK